MKKCPFCGSRLRDDDMFCYGCGKRYQEPENDIMTCKFCNTKLLEDAVYCLHCGEPIYGGKNPYKDYSADKAQG